MKKPKSLATAPTIRWDTAASDPSGPTKTQLDALTRQFDDLLAPLQAPEHQPE